MVILYTATLITARGVIPAPHQVRDKLQRESSLLPMRASLRGGAWPGGKITGFPRIKYGAGLVKPGMTDCVKHMSSCIIE